MLDQNPEGNDDEKLAFLEKKFGEIFADSSIDFEQNESCGAYQIREKTDSEMVSPIPIEKQAEKAKLTKTCFDKDDSDVEMLDDDSIASEELKQAERKKKKNTQAKKKGTAKKSEPKYAVKEEDEEMGDSESEHGGGGKGDGTYFWQKKLHDEFMKHFTVWGKTWKVVSQKMCDNGITEKDQLQCRTHGQKYLLSLAEIKENLKKNIDGKIATLDRKIC